MNNPSAYELLVRIDENVERIDHVLFGNGRPGLLEDFVTLKSEVASLTKTTPSKKEKTTAIIALVGTFVTAVGGVVVALVS